MVAMYNRQELERLLKAFYKLTRLRTAVMDERGQDIYSYPQQLPEFCRLLRESSEARQQCLACDRLHCAEARRHRDALIYTCHAGLTEVVTPMRVNGVLVGFLLLGHVMNAADKTAGWAEVARRCAPYNPPMDKLRAAYEELRYSDGEAVEASAYILKIAATSLYQSQIAQLVPGSQADRINAYINEHLADELTNEVLCRTFSISRTALYHLAMQSYGCGITEHISRLRIQRAIHLLIESDMSNNEVAGAVGIRDYNYFSKKFRQQTGYSPREYRRRFMKNADTLLKSSGIHLY